MFENSIAFTISTSREGHWRLAEFTDWAGFARATPYRNVHLMAQEKNILLPFCLVDGKTDPALIKEAMADIRSSPEIDICFMPIVMLTAETSEAFIASSIASGFDDVIALPCRTADFAQRIKHQMETQLNYFKTETYFGPDRRRGRAATHHPDRRGGAGYSYEKFVIRRNRRSGVKILSHEKFSPDDVDISAMMG